MSADTYDQERITGALACMGALHLTVKITENAPSNESVADEFRRKDTVFDLIMKTGGSLSPKAYGVLSVMVEMFLDSLMNGYTAYDQIDSGWLNEATMTAQEKEASRAATTAEIEADSVQ